MYGNKNNIRLFIVTMYIVLYISISFFISDINIIYIYTSLHSKRTSLHFCRKKQSIWLLWSQEVKIMFLELSNTITQYLIHKGIISEHKKNWSVYFFEKKLIKFSFCFSITIFLVNFFPLLDILIFLFTFLHLRKYSGGYHSNTVVACFFISLLLSIIGINIAYLIKYIPPEVTCFVSIISVLILWQYAPINHPSLHFSNEEFQAVKEKNHDQLVRLFFIEFILFLFGSEKLYLIVSSCICVSIMLIFSKLFNQEANYENC